MLRKPQWNDWDSDFGTAVKVPFKGQLTTGLHVKDWVLRGTWKVPFAPLPEINHASWNFFPSFLTFLKHKDSKIKVIGLIHTHLNLKCCKQIFLEGKAAKVSNLEAGAWKQKQLKYTGEMKSRSHHQLSFWKISFTLSIHSLLPLYQYLSSTPSHFSGTEFWRSVPNPNAPSLFLGRYRERG